MRALLAALLLSAVGLAHAQVPMSRDYMCVPGVYGDTLDIGWPKWRAEGMSIVWLCFDPVTKATRAEMLACVSGACLTRDTFAALYESAAKASNPQEAVRNLMRSQGVQKCPPLPNDTPLGKLCALVAADQAEIAARTTYAGPADAPPAEVWTVEPLTGATDRPTRIWPYQYTAGGSIRMGSERVAVGAPCDPAVGEGDWRGVLGRADRVARCKMQPRQ